jgi:hypothetical protein
MIFFREIMQGPHFIPDHLVSYQSYATDEELLQALKQNLDDLVLFFEYACKDEKWVLRHSKFIRLVLRWATKQFYLGNLSFYYAHDLVKVIQSHYLLLHPFLFFRPALFFTLKMRLGKQVILINSLLFGIGSPTLRRVFKRECFEKLNDEWILHPIKPSTFQLIENYLYTGRSPDLWKHDYDTIVDLMTQAQAWEIRGLVKDCASHLRRYD